MASEGCIQHAGILDADEKLTPATKKKIIERIKKCGEQGSVATYSFSRSGADEIKPSPGVVPKDLEDEKKYPGFHTDIFLNYEKIAKGFNLKIENSALPPPICDPLFIAAKLGIDLEKLPKFNIATDLIKIITIPDFLPKFLDMDLPKFTIKLPELFEIPPPIPPKIPVPEFTPPTFNASINLAPLWTDKYDFEMWQVKMPLAFIEFITKNILPFNIDTILNLASCNPWDLVTFFLKTGIFGPIGEGEIMKRIVAFDMACFSSECASVAAVGVAIGSAPVPGVTGTMGVTYGYNQPEPEPEPPEEDKHIQPPIKLSKRFFPALSSNRGGERNSSLIRLIIVHSTEGITATSAAGWFLNPVSKASAHVCVDDSGGFLCLNDGAVPNAAEGANIDGLHIEIAGFAKWSRSEWMSHPKALENAANVIGQWATKYKIPLTHLSYLDLRDLKKRGVSTHIEVADAFKKASHTDPGGSFPMDYLLERAKLYT